MGRRTRRSKGGFTLLWAIALIPLGCGDGDDPISEADAGVDATEDIGADAPLVQCGGTLCIEPEGDGIIPGFLVDEGQNSACFRGSGFSNQPAPRVILDGVELQESSGNGLTCLGGLLPAQTRNGELWVVQGVDADGDGVTDPGTDVESNRLQLVTRPWITDVSPSEVRVGEPITLTAENLPPPEVPLIVWKTGGCVAAASEPVGSTLTMTPTSDTLSQECGFDLVIGARWAGNPRPVENATDLVTILPSYTLGCATRAGFGCTILGTGLGADTGGAPPAARTVEFDGVEVDYEWGQTSVTFTVPADTAPGTYPVRLMREDGREISGEARVLGWGRERIGQEILGFEVGHTGTLSDIPVGAIAEDGSFVQGNEFYVGFGFGLQGWGPLDTASTDPRRVFLPGTYTGPAFTAAPWTPDYECGRSRTMILPPVQDLITGPPLVAVAAPRRGHCGWETGLEFPIEIGVYHSDGSPLFGQFSELLSYPQGTRSVLTGMARFVFDSEPPRPDPDGRLGRLIPIVAISNLDEGMTELFRLIGAEFVPHVDEPFAGIGTLYEAGETLYLAGGEDGFTGSIYEVGWLESREVPPPIAGLGPERMPHFAGARDGSLWVTVVTEGGAVEMHRWSPIDSAWSLVSTVPDTVPGADRPGLGDNPNSLGFFDLAVFEGTPVVAAKVRVGDSVGAALYAPDADGEWNAVFEEFGLWEWEDRPCGGWVTNDDERATVDCPPNQHEIYAPGWIRLEGAVESLRLWSAEDAVWARYRRSDQDIAQGHSDWVTRPLAGEFGR